MFKSLTCEERSHNQMLHKNLSSEFAHMKKIKKKNKKVPLDLDHYLQFPMKHPFQLILANREGSLLFASTKNVVQVFSTENGQLIAKWIDPIDTFHTLKKQQKEKIQALKEKTEGPVKIPKIPVPGKGAPPIFNYIRNMHLTGDESKLIVTTDSDKAVVILELNLDNSDFESRIVVLSRQAFAKRPCAISIKEDDSRLVVADKFGDVYDVSLDKNFLTLEQQAPKKSILGHVSMLTNVIFAKNHIITSDRDEHIRVTQYPKTYIIERYLFGHSQFVSCLKLCPWNEDILISGGGDDFINIWNWTTGDLLFHLDLTSYVQPLITDRHLAPMRFQNKEGNLTETNVSELLVHDHKLFVLIECTSAVLIFDFQSTDNLPLLHVIKTQSPVVHISIALSKLYVALEDYTIDGFEIFDTNTFQPVLEDVSKNIYSNSTVEFESTTEQYPLYHVAQLRKRGEH